MQNEKNWEKEFAAARTVDELEERWKAQRSEVMIRGRFGYHPPKLGMVIFTIGMGIFIALATLGAVLFAYQKQGIGKATLYLFGGIAVLMMIRFLIKDELARLPIYKKAHAAYKKRKSQLVP